MDGARRVVGAIMVVMLLGLLDVLSAEAAWVNNHDGTVSDTATGLVWQQGDSENDHLSWKDALAYCEGLNLAGRSDWRLPNIRELQSIVDYSRFDPASDPVFKCPSRRYWSSSTSCVYNGPGHVAWIVNLYTGQVEMALKYAHVSARCVRNQPMTVADFSGTPVVGEAPLSVQFTDVSAGSITEWMWDFGDGTTSTEQHTNHTYVTAGTYSVTLTVFGPLGSDTKMKYGFIEVSPPDLSITVTDAPDPVVRGTDLTYTLQISNAGPAGATRVVVKDTLPSKVTFISAASSQGSCTRSLRKVTCKLGKVAAGGSAQIQIVVQPTKTGTVTNTASVVSNEADPDTVNNTATTTTRVKRKPTVTIAATDPQATEAGRTKGQFTIYRKGGGTSVPLVVNYIVSGTAKNEVDYATLSGTQTIPAGASKAVINVKPVNDKLAEGDETVVLSLEVAPAYLVGSASTAVVTIVDNDLPVVTITNGDIIP